MVDLDIQRPSALAIAARALASPRHSASPITSTASFKASKSSGAAANSDALASHSWSDITPGVPTTSERPICLETPLIIAQIATYPPPLRVYGPGVYGL